MKLHISGVAAGAFARLQRAARQVQRKARLAQRLSAAVSEPGLLGLAGSADDPHASNRREIEEADSFIFAAWNDDERDDDLTKELAAQRIRLERAVLSILR
jgi:hypothetical protein